LPILGRAARLNVLFRRVGCRDYGKRMEAVSWLERRHLQASLSALPKAQPRRLVMDEFAPFKGHCYASVVLDADKRRALWVRPFF
jgi:hypothetical protein